MNSEELELSLRTEFENYLKSALADMKQEVSDFQEKFESELDKHKANLDEVFKEFSEKIKDDKELEDSFKETVTEHLKLARDEGARITATAIAEAEKMEEEKVSSSAVNFSDLRDAIDEISSKDTQSEILKSLVHYAAEYTPRGAFFIVKNEHLVGWRIFGKEEHSNPQSVREVFFPVASETALGESIKTLATIESGYGSYGDDSIYLNQLEFGQPEKMYSIPLVARGRGVAVLYADAGTEGDSVNSEALETLVRVAGLTVEVLASSKAVKPQEEQRFSQESEVEESEEVQEFAESEAEVSEVETPESYAFADTGVAVEEEPPVEEEDFSYQQDIQPETVEEDSESEETQEDYFNTDNESIEEIKVEEESSSGFDFQPVEQEEETAEEAVEEASEEEQTNYGDFSWNQSPAEAVEEVQETASDEYQVETEETFEEESPVQFADSSPAEETQFEYQQEEPVEYEVETNVSDNYTDNEYALNQEAATEEAPVAFDSNYQETFEQPEEEVVVEEKAEEVAEQLEEAPAEVETSAPAPRPRFGDRNVDLPIEVAEDERRLHNDARRFARLLVSEIKLYNEQKVKEGRESADLYERLREAIDRSREMYDKRVQPPVAAKFDYFHYELVNTLAEGEEPKLGGSYPGAAV